MKDAEDEAFDELAKRQGHWGGGFPAKRKMAADKVQEPEREALKLALEALESSRVFVTTREKIKHPEGTKWYDERITAIKEALAQPAQETNKNGSPCPEFWDWLPKAYNFEGDGNFTKYNMEVAFLAGKQALQPEQDGVAMADYMALVEKYVALKVAQPAQEPANDFYPDYDTEAVLVEEMQRMAKRIEELEAMLERQTSRIVDLQAHIANLEGEN